MPSFANPQSLNRYAFVLNNPLKYTDPTGHMALCDARCDEGGGAIASSTGQLTYYDVPAAQQCGSCVTTTTVTEDYVAGPAIQGSGGGTTLAADPYAGLDTFDDTNPGTVKASGCVVCDTQVVGDDWQDEHIIAPTSVPYGPCLGLCLVAGRPSNALNGGLKFPKAAAVLNVISTTLDIIAGGIGVITPALSLAVCGATVVLACVPGGATYISLQEAEAIVSFASTIVTALGDVANGNSGFDLANGQLVIRQDTLVSTTLSIAGGLAVDPLSDTVINGTQIGYDIGGYAGYTGPYLELRLKGWGP